MAEIMIDRNLQGFGGDFFQMQEAVVKLQKSLTWLLGQLDSLNVRRLSTNETVIMSSDGNTVLDGTQIIMKDKDGNERLVQGLNRETGLFEFRIKAGDGETTTIYLDEDGNAVFTGTVAASQILGGTIAGVEITGGEIKSGTTIDVGTNATIGETLTLKDGENTGGTISVFDGDVPTLLISGAGGRPINISTDTTLWLHAHTINMSAPGGVKVGNKKVVTEGTGNMYVTVGGVDYPVWFDV